MVESFKRQIYENTNGIDLLLEPESTTTVEEYEFCIVQSDRDCIARFELNPKPNSKSKVTIYIYADNEAAVDCVCTVNIPKDVEGVETDVQIRSWPFDNSRIQARPEMYIKNSNVVARHGNALGTLDTTSKYYLESKGLSNFKDLIKQSLLNV